GVQFNTAARALNVALHDVHAHASARDVAYHLSRREAGLEDQLPHVLIGHGILDAHSAAARFRKDSIAMQAAAIVDDLDHDAAALMESAQRDRSRFGLAGRTASFWCLDAVIEAIAHQMGEWVGDLFDHAFVELGPLAYGLELHALTKLCCEVVNQPREAAEHECDQQHANRHHGLLQIARVALEVCEPLHESTV